MLDDRQSVPHRGTMARCTLSYKKLRHPLEKFQRISYPPDFIAIMSATVPSKTRKVGNDDVTAIGFGAMGISAFYGSIQPDEERLQVSQTRCSLADFLLT